MFEFLMMTLLLVSSVCLVLFAGFIISGFAIQEFLDDRDKK